MEDIQEHPRKGKWHKAKKVVSKKDKRTPRRDPICDSIQDLMEPLKAQEEMHYPMPSAAKIFAVEGYEGLEDLRLQCDICTSCDSCKAQKQANTLWLKENAKEIEKAKDQYNKAKEEEQERREWFDWSYRNKHY